jgi:hypothetical protein
MATDARSCNGAGSCSSLSTHPCGAFICGATACLTSCTDNSQCVSGDACVSGQCTACSTGLTVCPNLCVNLQTSNAHCGACSGTGSVCSANQQCAGGKCLSVDGQSCSNNTQCVSGICNTFYQDGDGDGYPVTSPSVGYCNASTSPVSGYIPARSDGKWDCCDSDPSVKPGQSAFFTSPSLTCIPNSGGWDYDCSGGIEKQPEAHVGDTCTADTATTCLLTTADGIPTEDCGQSYGYPFLCSLRGICGWANFAADVGLVACH